jgi:hypothetical protein
MSDRNGLILFKDLVSSGGSLKAEDLDNNFRRVNIIDGENYTIEHTDHGVVMSFPGTVQIFDNGINPINNKKSWRIDASYKNGTSESVVTEEEISSGGTFIGWWV